MSAIASPKLPLCTHIKDDGQPCGAIAVKGTPHCYFHRRFFAAPALPGESQYLPPLLETHHSIQLALTDLYQAFLTRKIDLREARFSLQILRLASRTICAIEKSQAQSPRTPVQLVPADKPLPNAPVTNKPPAEAAATRQPTPDPAPTAKKRVMPAAPPSTQPQPKAVSKPPQPAYKGERIVDPYGCLAHLK